VVGAGRVTGQSDVSQTCIGIFFEKLKKNQTKKNEYRKWRRTRGSFLKKIPYKLKNYANIFAP
jgi:hypothetical protein